MKLMIFLSSLFLAITIGTISSMTISRTLHLNINTFEQINEAVVKLAEDIVEENSKEIGET
jgi:hypothetical protein